MMFDPIQKNGIYQRRIYIIHLLTIVGIVLFPAENLLYGLLLAWVIYQFIACIGHEYICHEYIRPRNSVVEFFCLMLWASITGETIKDKKSYHIHHHRYYQDRTQDPTAANIDSTNFLGFVTDYYVATKTPVSTREKFMFSTPLLNWVDQHSTSIKYSVMLLAFIILPVAWFFTVFVFCFTFLLLMDRIHVWSFHYTDNIGDRPWMVLLFGSNAWHTQHHITWKDTFWGTKYLKYLNPQWYIAKLLFKPA